MKRKTTFTKCFLFFILFYFQQTTYPHKNVNKDRNKYFRIQGEVLKKIMDKELEKLRGQFDEKITSLKLETFHLCQETNDKSTILIKRLQEKLNQQRTRLPKIASDKNAKEIEYLNDKLEKLSHDLKNDDSGNDTFVTALDLTDVMNNDNDIPVSNAEVQHEDWFRGKIINGHRNNPSLSSYTSDESHDNKNIVSCVSHVGKIVKVNKNINDHTENYISNINITHLQCNAINNEAVQDDNKNIQYSSHVSSTNETKHCKSIKSILPCMVEGFTNNYKNKSSPRSTSKVALTDEDIDSNSYKFISPSSSDVVSTDELSDCQYIKPLPYISNVDSTGLKNNKSFSPSSSDREFKSVSSGMSDVGSTDEDNDCKIKSVSPTISGVGSTDELSAFKDIKLLIPSISKVCLTEQANDHISPGSSDITSTDENNDCKNDEFTSTSSSDIVSTDELSDCQCTKPVPSFIPNVSSTDEEIDGKKNKSFSPSSSDVCSNDGLRVCKDIKTNSSYSSNVGSTDEENDFKNSKSISASSSDIEFKSVSSGISDVGSIQDHKIKSVSPTILNIESADELGDSEVTKPVIACITNFASTAENNELISISLPIPNIAPTDELPDSQYITSTPSYISTAEGNDCKHKNCISSSSSDVVSTDELSDCKDITITDCKKKCSSTCIYDVSLSDESKAHKKNITSLFPGVASLDSINDTIDCKSAKYISRATSDSIDEKQFKNNRFYLPCISDIDSTDEENWDTASSGSDTDLTEEYLSDLDTVDSQYISSSNNPKCYDNKEFGKTYMLNPTVEKLHDTPSSESSTDDTQEYITSIDIDKTLQYVYEEDENLPQCCDDKDLNLSRQDCNKYKTQRNNYYKQYIGTPLTKKKCITLLMIMDSNSRYLELKKLWKSDGTLTVFCGSFSQVSKVVSNDNNPLKYILLNVGVNELDSSRPKEVHRELINLIRNIQQKYNNIKTILSEITPRTDKLDQAVIATNKLLRKSLKTETNVFLICHDNLRNNNFFCDDRHFTKEIAPLFAANIKGGLCKAYSRQTDNYNYRFNDDTDWYKEFEYKQTNNRKDNENETANKQKLTRKLF